MNQHTIWDFKGAVVETVDGVKKYEKWCKDLIVKLKKARGINLYFKHKKTKGGEMIALFKTKGVM